MEPSDVAAYRHSANRGGSAASPIDRVMASGSGVISPVFKSIT
jgi:hypothetical protein